MLRSVPMAFCEIYMQPATAFETMAQLGQLKCVQFVDCCIEDPTQVRSYTSEICRCVEIESKMQYFEAQIRKEGNKVIMLDPESDPKPIHPSEMVMFEKMIEKWERDISEISENIVQLKLDLMELKEIDGIIRYIGPMLDASKEEIEELKAKFLADAGDTCCQEQQLYILCGVMERSKAMLCQQMLWRISHGNIHYRQTDKDIVLNEPCKGEMRKVAFIAACQSKELLIRLEKVCAAFKAKMYPCPTNQQERAELQKKLDDRINELDSILGKSRYYRIMALRSVAKQWRGWSIQICKTKAIYYQMNLMKLDNPINSLIGKCWVKEKDIPKIQMEMNKCMRALGVQAPSVIIKVPNPEIKGLIPTVQHTNKFTYGPQVLINTYGIAQYREINPALFAIVGLPFLFALMFSDMGHAVILLGIAFWLIVQEKDYEKIKGNAFWDIFFGARYVMLMMGIWSFITGFCYNQLFAKSINISGSMYRNVMTESLLNENSMVVMGPNSRLHKPYIWGMDPVWQIARNKLKIKNSHMLKVAVTIGTLHMLFGLALSAWNFCYFQNYQAIYLQFLPKFLIILIIFGYTSFLFYYKWIVYYAGNTNLQKSAECAPSLLRHFIQRFFPHPIYRRMTMLIEPCVLEIYKGQVAIEFFLHLILIFSVFLLLFGTPLYIVFYNRTTRRNIEKEIRDYRSKHMKDCKLSCTNPCGTYCEEACGKRVDQWKEMIDKHSTPFAPLLITQFLSTLEFCMALIVHAASYLRIWALSMGHYILTEALWIMFLRNIGLRLINEPFSILHIVLMVVGFIFFAIFTFIVVVVMEGICCFLHALRLHWIEFMSKFFGDEGYAFRPFSFDCKSKEMDKTQEVCAVRKPRDKDLKECESTQPL